QNYFLFNKLEDITTFNLQRCSLITKNTLADLKLISFETDYMYYDKISKIIDKKYNINANDFINPFYYFRENTVQPLNQQYNSSSKLNKYNLPSFNKKETVKIKGVTRLTKYYRENGHVIAVEEMDCEGKLFRYMISESKTKEKNYYF